MNITSAKAPLRKRVGRATSWGLVPFLAATSAIAGSAEKPGWFESQYNKATYKFAEMFYMSGTSGRNLREQLDNMSNQDSGSSPESHGWRETVKGWKDITVTADQVIPKVYGPRPDLKWFKDAPKKVLDHLREDPETPNQPKKDPLDSLENLEPTDRKRPPSPPETVETRPPTRGPSAPLESPANPVVTAPPVAPPAPETLQPPPASVPDPLAALEKLETSHSTAARHAWVEDRSKAVLSAETKEWLRNNQHQINRKENQATRDVLKLGDATNDSVIKGLQADASAQLAAERKAEVLKAEQKRIAAKQAAEAAREKTLAASGTARAADDGQAEAARRAREAQDQLAQDRINTSQQVVYAEAVSVEAPVEATGPAPGERTKKFVEGAGKVAGTGAKVLGTVLKTTFEVAGGVAQGVAAGAASQGTAPAASSSDDLAATYQALGQAMQAANAAAQPAPSNVSQLAQSYRPGSYEVGTPVQGGYQVTGDFGGTRTHATQAEANRDVRQRSEAAADWAGASEADRQQMRQQLDSMGIR